MLINVSSISSVKSDGTVSVDVKKLIEVDDYNAYVSLIGTVAKNDEVYEFNGIIDGDVHTYCARCLKELTVPYKNELTLVFMSNRDLLTENADFSLDIDEDILFFDGSVVDFEPVVSGVIRADMPISFVCADSCKGLCSFCGNNLNTSKCACNEGYVNPAFDVLKSLVFDNE